MAQNIEEDVFALIIKAARLTSDVFLDAVKSATDKSSVKPAKQGKQTVEQLAGGSSKLQNIEITDKNIKSFESSAKAFGISYALKKIPDESPPKYIVFFKGKDVNQVNRAFKDYAIKQTTDAKKHSLSEIKDLNAELIQIQQQNRERKREKSKDRGVEH